MSYEHIKKKKLREFKLVKEIGRVPAYVVNLDPEQEARAMSLHKESIVMDFHCHPLIQPENMEEDFEGYFIGGRIHIGYEGLKASGLTGLFFGMGLGASFCRLFNLSGTSFSDLVYELGVFFSDLHHHRDEVIVARFAEDIRRAKAENKIAVFAGFEHGDLIGESLNRIDILYGLGFRSMGLTWETNSLIGGGRSEGENIGLTRFGQDVVGRMNELGMLIDLPHSSDAVITETLELSEVPCILSHDCACSIHNIKRCKSDEILRAIAEKGGVIGVESVPNVLSANPRQGVEDVIDHMEHMIKVAGVDHVAVGSDSSFGDHVGVHKFLMKHMHLGVAGGLPAQYVEGFENPGEIPNVTRELVRRGYSDDDIKKLIGGNVLRIVEDVVG